MLINTRLKKSITFDIKDYITEMYIIMYENF